ncbi:unnamed protein product [Hymenolepis diminuta]|uniref:Uncharacterized protein n=1 Tax=Hymenolepis diminuta TaxID=6216 RepID=A0A564YC78_HYMDI|nr:unnamed protein product [Hymenolepis diminuta]
MEMLDVTAGGQWTSLTSFGLSRRLRIHSMARVGNELFMSCFSTHGLYSVELDSDLKRQLAKWKKRKFVPDGKLMTVHLK